MVPNIDSGKTPKELLNVKHLLPLPASTSFGNLELKWMKIIQRLDHINDRIENLNSLHQKKLNSIANDLPDQGLMDELLVGDEIVFWLKRTTDELLALIYLKEKFNSPRDFPTKIEIDCIGRFLEWKEDLCGIKEKHSDFLKELNEMANAHKHSFINSDHNFLGNAEPHVFALTLNQNDLNKKSQFYAVPVRKIVNKFNLFFETARDVLKSWVR